MEDDSIQLRYVREDNDPQAQAEDILEYSEHHGQQKIPPADKGKDAWLFLAACFILEALVWGFPFAFGLFQEFYSSHEPFSSHSNITIIGTCAMGIMYLDAPLVFAAMKKWPNLRRASTVVGLFTMCIALAASSFSQSVAHLIFTQGILYAIGGSLAYSPAILFVNEWFVKRRGLAFGVMWAGTGVGGLVCPLVLQWLLSSYGFRTALRIWSLSLFILTFPMLFFLRPRLPVSRNDREHGPRKLFDLSFLKTSHFLILQFCNILESLGFFLPSIFLPTFSQQTMHSSPWAATLTVILVNISSVFGCIFMGSLIDRYHVTTCILVSTIGATLGVFCLWGFATSLPLLYVFCVVYGLFAGSFSSTWTGIIRSVQGKADNADAGLIFAFLAFGRGVGNICSGPLSEALMNGQPWLGEAKLAYGTGYGPLIIFTGVSALLGGMSFLTRSFGYL